MGGSSVHKRLQLRTALVQGGQELLPLGLDFFASLADLRSRLDLDPVELRRHLRS